MVRIPLIKRQPKSDSLQAEEGSGKSKDSKSKDTSRFGKDKSSHSAGLKDGKGTSTASGEVHYRGLQASGKDDDGSMYVLGTDKKIPLPGKTPKKEGMAWSSPAAPEAKAVTLTLPETRPETPPAETAFVAKVLLPELPAEAPEAARESKKTAGEAAPVPMAPAEVAAEASAAAADKSSIPESPAEVHDAAPPAEAAATPSGTALPASLAGHDQRESAEKNTVLEAKDALVMLQAMPDFIFCIGRDGIRPVPRDGSHAIADTVSTATGGDEPPDGRSVTHEEDKPRPLETVILEELRRQSEPHTKKVLDTKQLQRFEFQIGDDKQARHLEARLTPLREGEVMAVVRDITEQKKTHDALIESKNEMENHLKERNAELIRVNKMLKTEVELREEQEEVLKKNFRKLEALLDDTIGAITLIVEQRDPHIADHQRRVCQLACAIAQEMRSRSDRMRAVRIAAQLHDLGLIFVPAEILRKPGKLTEAEMSVVRTHPDTDYQILKRINFPISIADVVRQHHERMDGSGYPQGLKGDDILIEARIIAVADVIEGMVFERPYRVAPGLEAALKEIADNKGKLYDPDVADVCLKLFSDNKFQFESVPCRQNGGSAGPVPDSRDL
ncbi:MAG: HD domain-containing phosphohydrolase [Dehalococcoidia bacterium]|nr:HD domain-containing phosphohydrolase [Dehalococcoidia bacterium]